MRLTQQFNAKIAIYITYGWPLGVSLLPDAFVCLLLFLSIHHTTEFIKKLNVDEIQCRRVWLLEIQYYTEIWNKMRDLESLKIHSVKMNVGLFVEPTHRPVNFKVDLPPAAELASSHRILIQNSHKAFAILAQQWPTTKFTHQCRWVGSINETKSNKKIYPRIRMTIPFLYLHLFQRWIFVLFSATGCLADSIMFGFVFVCYIFRVILRCCFGRWNWQANVWIKVLCAMN